MVRRGVVVGVFVPLLWLLWGMAPHAAAAPGGYPGPTTTTAPGETSEHQNGGRVLAGETGRVESCGFAVQQPENEVQAGPVGLDVTPEDPKTVFVDWNYQATGSAEVGDDGCAV